MFTGLIEEVGKIIEVHNLGGGKRIKVQAKKIMNDLKIDDSVSINGVCQTVVSIDKNTFEVEAVEETLSKTTLGSFKASKKVNLERAARLGDRLGGHLVQGHTDITASVKSIDKQSTGILIWIEIPVTYSPFVVQHGSISIDGVSLTVARLTKTMLMVSVIPHTWKNTTLSLLSNGDKVNLEFDIIGKYIQNFVNFNSSQVPQTNSILDQYITQPDF